jgi:hypothetical protein
VTVAPSPFYSLKGRGTRGNTKELQCLQLVCPVVRRCPSGRIGAELRYLVGEAVAWLG